MLLHTNLVFQLFKPLLLLEDGLLHLLGDRLPNLLGADLSPLKERVARVQRPGEELPHEPGATRRGGAAIVVVSRPPVGLLNLPLQRLRVLLQALLALLEPSQAQLLPDRLVKKRVGDSILPSALSLCLLLQNISVVLC